MMIRVSSDARSEALLFIRVRLGVGYRVNVAISSVSCALHDMLSAEFCGGIG